MAFRDINTEKLAFLVSHGTHEGELRKFFLESKIQLLQKGAKVQNLPHGREERIRVLCTKLGPRTDDVVYSWFNQNISVTAPMPAEEVVIFLETYFDEGAVPGSEAQEICRSALTLLMDESPNAALIRLLQRPMGPRREVSSGAPERYSNTHLEVAERPHSPEGDYPSEDGPSVPHYHISELLAAIIANDDSSIDNALGPFTESTRLMVEALLSLRSGDASAARQHLEHIEPNSPESELVRTALARASHQRSTSAPPSGIRVVIPQPASRDIEAPKYEIVGIYTNETSSGAVFVEPVAVVVDDHLWGVSREDRNWLFPESGAVMTHRTQLRRSLKRGELVHWSVSERDGAEGKTRFHMDSELTPLAKMARVDIPSSDPDEVRERIKAIMADGRIQPGQPMLFLLSDGVAIAPPKGADYTREDVFDKPWQAWSSLTTWLIEGNQYCLDLISVPASSFDLSTLYAAFKKLLKDLESKQKLSLSKAQRREITELIRGDFDSDVSHRARRIAASLDQISISEMDLDLVLELIGSHRDVKQRVDDLVAQDLEKRLAEKSGVQAEAAALRRKIAQLEREGRDLERANKKQAEATTGLVRNAFESAVREGAATLANAEVFHMLLGAKSSNDQTASTTGQVSDWVVNGALTRAEVQSRHNILGINARKSAILSALADVAFVSGVALTIKGRLARQCALTLARQDRDTVAFTDIPMGLTSSDLLRDRFRAWADVNAWALLNADLSPLEIYGTELLDMLFERAMVHQPDEVPIILACQGGEYCLPISDALCRVSLMVDLDSKWDEDEFSFDEVDSEMLALLPSLLGRVAKALDSVEDSLRPHVERALVRSLRRHD